MWRSLKETRGVTRNSSSQRWVAFEQGRIVGAGSYSQSVWFAHPQKFMFWIGVRPELQGYGIGSMLYETIMHGCVL